MPEFTYIARDLTGKRVEGTLAANSEREAVATLSGKDLFPLKVSTADGRPTGVKSSPRVKARIMAGTYGQLSALLGSGVPLLRSLDLLREQTPHKNLAFVLEDVHARVQEGATLADAMVRHPKAFGELATSIIRAGGEGGFLEEALDRLAKFTEQQDELKSRVVGALAYPTILFVLGTVVVNVLIICFVPKFERLFTRLRERGELPAVTDWLLWLSKVMQSYGIFIAGGLVLIGLVIRSRIKTEEGRLLLDKLRLKVPVVSGIYLSMAVSRFCRVLGTLLTNGVPIVKSLEISADSTGNRVLSTAVRQAAENISAGESLATPLAASGQFPADVVEMIAVGEQSNNLEHVLPHIADTLERDTWRRLDLFVRLLEPLMLVLLAGVVLIVVIALLVPVLKMSTTV
ncbi:MAG TPA: type II secretion system F family protein [Lacipirellulaceae bacterium]|jgi:general secretion pathway protein F/type IV pilus assembly protein PilC|nr:type II secretion system F family protein [Lacipirellulaceae bacterium]